MYKLVLSAALASLLAGAGVANANTSTGPSSLITDLSFNAQGTASFSRSISGSHSFDDFFNFSVPTGTFGSTLALAVSGFTSSLADKVAFTSFGVFSGTPGTGTPLNSVSSFFPLFNANGIAATSISGLAAGNYYFELTGTTTACNADYSGTVNLLTAPVPEPESYALLLAGLGLMGTIARRRSKREGSDANLPSCPV